MEGKGRVYLERRGCVFCDNDEDWYGYVINGKRYPFCEVHKVEWVKFAQERGAEFAKHHNNHGVTDGYSACIRKLSEEKQIEIFKEFLMSQGVKFEEPKKPDA